MDGLFSVSGDRLFLSVKAVPGSSKTEFAGLKDRRLRVRIAAAPEKGRANEALCAFIAKALGCGRRDVSLAAGEKSPLKTLVIPALHRAKLEELLRTLETG
ncbi:MAG: DUF167 domain-containing protein [Treponema sp.]|jgi:uncharacterized protein (TIGR00251 family)|nr:DUF167 domain-containing protein [Treponema sp.]